MVAASLPSHCHLERVQGEFVNPQALSCASYEECGSAQPEPVALSCALSSADGRTDGQASRGKIAFVVRRAKIGGNNRSFSNPSFFPPSRASSSSLHYAPFLVAAKPASLVEGSCVLPFSD